MEREQRQKRIEELQALILDLESELALLLDEDADDNEEGED